MNIEFNKKISWIEKSTDYTAKNKDRILVTTSGITITLPTSPSLGDCVWIANGKVFDYKNLTSFTISSVKIFGVTRARTFLFYKQQFVEFIYQDSTVGWIYHELSLNEPYNFSKLSSSYYHSACIRGSDGSAWAWGDNAYGQLGNNTTTTYSSPISVLGGFSFSEISSTGYHIICIRGSDGTAWAWGHNQYGQLGDNSRTFKSSPTSVVGGFSFSKVFTGFTHSLGILGSDGTAWAWGDNTCGQLGNNTTTSNSSPISVVGGFSFSQISSCPYRSHGIRGSDGSVWSWGLNTYGQLGNNTRTSYSSPVSVVGGFSFSQISCASNHTIGIRGSDGSAWAWGANDYGQLGNNTRTSYSSPVSVVGGFSFSQISCGGTSITGINGSDGSAWSWGDNSYGQLGDNSMISKSSPVSVVGGFSFSLFYAGRSIVFGINGSDNSFWGWGYNQYGQLGNNTITSYSSPIFIG